MGSDDTEALLVKAQAGDVSAMTGLLNRHRGRLRRMIESRMDPRVGARIDASDVIQETLVEATQKLADFARHRPIPFYPWLRKICWQRLVKLHDFHLRAAKRSVRREKQLGMDLPDHSSIMLASRVVGHRKTPSKAAMVDELLVKVRAAVDQLSGKEREVMVLRYLEQMSTKEIATVVEASEPAVNMRHMRALERLRTLLDDESLGGVIR